MKDYNRKEIAEGDILKGEDCYCRVLFVGKERIITTYLYENIEEAKNTERDGTNWSQNEINRYKLTIVSRKPLGVYDENGDEYHYGDMTDEGEVFYAIKSMKEGGSDYIYCKNKDEESGWEPSPSNHCTIQKPNQTMIDIDGKKYSKDTIKQALREYVK